MQSDLKELADNLIWCLEVIIGWMRANKLKFNPDKMELLLVESNFVLEDEMSMMLDGAVLP